MNSETRKAIFDVGKLTVAKFYFVEAPQNEETPYAVFSPVSMPSNRDSSNQYQEIVYQVQVYDLDLGNLESSVDTLKTELADQTNYTFPNYKIVGLYHQLDIPQQKGLNDLWSAGAQFFLELQPN